MHKDSINSANEKFKSKDEALTFAKVNFNDIINTINVFTVQSRKNDHILKKVSKVSISGAAVVTGRVSGVGGFQTVTNISDCLIVLGLKDNEGYLVDNIIEELE